MVNALVLFLLVCGCAQCDGQSPRKDEVPQQAQQPAPPQKATKGTREEQAAASNRQQEASSPSERFRYVLNTKSSGATMLVRLNGAVVDDDRDMPVSYGSTRITPWIHQGQNVLEVEILASSQRSGPEARIEVAKQIPKRRVETALVDRKWPKEGTQLNPPVTKSLRFELSSDVPPCRFFDEADPLRDSSKNQREATELARTIHRAYAQRDAERLAKLMRYQQVDRARCEQNENPESHPNPKQIAEKHLGYDELEELGDDIRLKRVLGKRAFHVTRDGAPLIRMKEDELWLSKHVYVGRIDGEWTWVR